MPYAEEGGDVGAPDPERRPREHREGDVLHGPRSRLRCGPCILKRRGRRQGRAGEAARIEGLAGGRGVVEEDGDERVARAVGERHGLGFGGFDWWRVMEARGSDRIVLGGEGRREDGPGPRVGVSEDSFFRERERERQGE